VAGAYCPECRSPVRGDEAACRGCATERPADGWPRDEQLGRLVRGRYRIERRLAAGGFGTVFLATHVQHGSELGRVVLKFLHGELVGNAKIRRRLLDEVRVARELTNPHIVRVLDIDEDEDGVPFHVQEYVDGEGLDRLLARGRRLPPAQAVEIARQIAEGLAEAHAKDVVHRDLKPENIRIERSTGLVKILDFGVARVVGPRGTATTSLIGTPRYMAPEQICGRQVDGRTDVYALGVLLFEMLAGEPPIPPEDTEMAYLSLNLTREPRRLRDVMPECPPDLDDVVACMLAKDPAGRPPDMATVIAALRQIASDQGWSLHTPSLEAAGPTPLALAATLPGGPAAMLPAVRAPAGAPTAVSVDGLAPRAPAVTSDSLALRHARRRRVAWLGAAVAVVAAAGAVAALLVARGSSSAPPAVSPSPAVPEGAPVAPGLTLGPAILEPAIPPSAATPDAGTAPAVLAPPTDAGLLTTLPTPPGGPATVDAFPVAPFANEPGRAHGDAGRRRDSPPSPAVDASGAVEPPPFEKIGTARSVP